MTNKVQLAVIYGGKSGEHDISITSASAVISQLDRDKYDITPIGITREGHWYATPLADVDPTAGKTLQVQTEASKPFNPMQFMASDVKAPFDVAFPVLHGVHGEDGAVQGLLELINVAYVGSGVLGSAICLDKDVTKRLALEADIPVVPYVAFNLGDWQLDAEGIVEDIEDELEYPVFVKPANTGSSVGVSKAKTMDELIKAVEVALSHHVKVVVEQGFDIREVEVAVLENPEYGKDPLTSVPGEITTLHEFYSYDAKYNDDELVLTAPADIPEHVAEEMQAMAADVFNVLEAEGMLRVDFFLDKDSDDIMFNEANTIPGFTSVSMYPLAWQASGVEYPELLDKLIDLAVARHGRKR